MFSSPASTGRVRRRILNHLAYAHLIPVIDGGIQVRFKKRCFTGVDWQLQTASPDRPCLECLGVYSNADVTTEIEGKLMIPLISRACQQRIDSGAMKTSFLSGANLASLEVLQLIALVTGIAGIEDLEYSVTATTQAL